MNKQIEVDAETRMKKTVDTVQHEFSQIRTGKASSALLDSIRVEYYGNMVPLNQVASIGIPEIRLITIQPWEKPMIPMIEKAILASELGLNPTNDGTLIRLPIPPLNEERRRDLVKLVKKLGEEGKVAIRNIRHDANNHVKREEKEKKMTEDEAKQAQDRVQKNTDRYIKQIDELVGKKEKEIMEV